MRKQLMKGVAGALYYSGLVALARWQTSRAGKRLIILNYHRAKDGDLRRQLQYLRFHYRIMHVEEALEELFAHAETEPEDRRTPLVLTFDDGYQDNYTHGFALACELQVPMTIYVIPGYIESGKHFWWKEGKRLVRRAQVLEAVVEGNKYCLDRPEERRELARVIDYHVRHACSVEERDRFLALVYKALAIPSSITEEEMSLMSLTWEQMREMDKSGWISFGAHTMHHPILAYLTDPSEVKREVKECRTILEEQLGHPVRTFAYPVGQAQHISETVVQAVQESGYSWALTTHYGMNTPQSNPFLLQRIEVDVDQHWLVVAAETAGLWGFFSRLRWLPFVRKYLTNSSK